MGMALAGLSRGRFTLHTKIPPTTNQIRSFSSYAAEGLKLNEIAAMAVADINGPGGASEGAKA
jgi:hypothetical protein